MLAMLDICLCLFFQDALTLNKIAILGQPPRQQEIYSELLAIPDNQYFLNHHKR